MLRLPLFRRELPFGVLLVLGALPFSESLFARTVDLNAQPAYVRPGFEAAWKEQDPTTAAGWRRIEPVRRGGDRWFRMHDLAFEGFPRRADLSFSLTEYPARTMSVAIPFDMEIPADPRVGTALLLSRIAHRWKIYLNGRLLHESEAGVAVSLGRKLVIDVPRSFLRTKDNLLVFEITGDPVSRFTGLTRGKPYLIGPRRELEATVSEKIPLVLIFIYLFTGLLHIFLYLRRTSETYNLWFGLFATFLCLYFSTRHRVAPAWIPDFDVLHRLELATLFIAIPLVGVFFESILTNRTTKVSRINWAYTALLVLLVGPWMSLVFIDDVLRVWQITTLFAVIPFYVFYRVGGQLIGEARALRATAPDAGPLRLIGQVLFKTVPGNLSVGALVLVGCAAYDIIDAIYLDLGIRVSEFGFLIFVVGIVLILANRFQATHARVADLNVHLEEKVADLNLANVRLKNSEEQYRRLVNGSTEIIFTVSPSGALLTVNRAFLRQLAYRAEQTTGLDIRDLIFLRDEDRGVSRSVLEKKLERAALHGGPETLRLTLGTSRGEPIEVRMNLERLPGGEDPEILCRCLKRGEDSLLRYFVSEKQTYRIENYLITAEEISQRLVRNAARYIDPEDVPAFRVALREIIINAIEHGNLGITYEEKNESLIANRYQDFIAERQQLPENRDKTVNIEFLLTARKLAYRITDQGAGFDYQGIRERALKEVSTARQHGRGILMTEQIFDEVRYNARGNQVMLVKYLNGHGPADATNKAGGEMDKNENGPF